LSQFRNKRPVTGISSARSEGSEFVDRKWTSVSVIAAHPAIQAVLHSTNLDGGWGFSTIRERD
jgi:hypothetical protein